MAAMTVPAASAPRWVFKSNGMETQKQRGSSASPRCFHPPSTTTTVALSPSLSSEAQSMAPPKEALVQRGRRGRRRKRDFVVTPEKLDQWISHAVGEIVRKTREAPVLIKVFSNSSDGSLQSLTLETEKASPANWAQAKKRWDQENCTPDAIILIEELKQEVEEGVDAGRDDATTKSWGLVIQGAAGGGGAGTGIGGGCVSCYVLNTTCAGSSLGFCTYYWLIRARLGEPLDVQLKKTWKV